MSETRKLEVGDTLWCQRAKHMGRSGLVEVTKIGRKWAYISQPGYGREERIDLETWLVDGKGYSSPGRCYLNETEYLRGQELYQQWRRFKSRVDRMWKVPEGMTVEKIQSAAEIIGVDLTEDPEV